MSKVCDKCGRKISKGFSLIELLIVIAVILIIAGIAIPNLLRARMAANEASAVASLRSINTVCISYVSNYGVYAPTLSNLGPSNGAPPTSTSADLLDSVLAPSGGVNSSAKSGYTFSYASPVANVGYTVNANPTSPNQSGTRFFYTDSSGVIRSNNGAVATTSDSPL